MIKIKISKKDCETIIKSLIDNGLVCNDELTDEQLEVFVRIITENISNK